MQRKIDLNCDMGESFGAWRMGDDAGVMPWITSANIACGFHAGDSATMHATVALAHMHGVAIGAHVGLPDLAGFGRRTMAIDAVQAYAYTLHQLGALSAFARAAATRVRHVKAHGALYHMLAHDAALAAAVVRATRKFDARLAMYGLADSALAAACTHAEIAFVAEAFADRRYDAEGRLIARSEPGAVIESVDDAVAQALVILGPAQHRDAGDVSSTPVNTLCVHGDGANAAQFARALRVALESARFEVVAPGHPTP